MSGDFDQSIPPGGVDPNQEAAGNAVEAAAADPKAAEPPATKLFLEIIDGDIAERPAFWLLRQAGRYMEEYRTLSAQAGGFLDMVTNPKLAAEVTMQPIRRFHPDAAILFSDILMVPYALQQKLEFVEGHGPMLDPIRVFNDMG